MTNTSSHGLRALAVIAVAWLAIGWWFSARASLVIQQQQAETLELIVTMLEQGAKDHRAQLEIMRDIRESLQVGHRLAVLKSGEPRHEDPRTD